MRWNGSNLRQARERANLPTHGNPHAEWIDESASPLERARHAATSVLRRAKAVCQSQAAHGTYVQAFLSGRHQYGTTLPRIPSKREVPHHDQR
jgi:hypothetical protein